MLKRGIRDALNFYIRAGKFLSLSPLFFTTYVSEETKIDRLIDRVREGDREKREREIERKKWLLVGLVDIL